MMRRDLDMVEPDQPQKYLGQVGSLLITTGVLVDYIFPLVYYTQVVKDNWGVFGCQHEKPLKNN